jgi:anti-sigma factor RsiW
MKSRFDELLPFYVNGTLNDADRAWVDDYLREHPGAAAELRWYESLRTKLVEDAPAVSSEVGMDRALHRMRTEGPTPHLPRRAAAPPWCRSRCCARRSQPRWPWWRCRRW